MITPRRLFFIVFIFSAFLMPFFVFGATTSIVLNPTASSTLSLFPATSTHAVDDVFSVDIILDTKGNAIEGVDILSLNYDPSVLEVQDENASTTGIQITPGILMPNTTANTANTASGTIVFSQTTDTGASFTGVGTIATIRFRARATTSATSLTFDFTPGNTTDTNVASGGVDILTSVTNGLYTIVSQAAPTPPPDTIAPSVPTNLAAVATSSTQIDLSWATSTDNIAVSGYQLYRDGARIATTTTTLYQDSGLSASTTYAYAVSAFDAAGNVSATSTEVTETTLPPPDITAPVRSDGLPFGILSAGTTQTELSLITNEEAMCKYGTTGRAGTAYASIANTFTTTGSTTHTTAITGLANGQSYVYYVRCGDTWGNMNIDDFVISFSVASPPISGGGGGGGGVAVYIPPNTGGGSSGGGGGGSTVPTPTVMAQQQYITETSSTTTPLSSTSTPPLNQNIREGELIRGPDGIKVYIVNAHGYKRHIFNPAVFEMYGHFVWSNILDVSQETLDSFITSDFYRAEGDFRVFSLKEIDERAGVAQKRWMNLPAERFLALGYRWEQVFIINTTERDYYQEGTALTENELRAKQKQISLPPARSLIKTADNPIVYYITLAGLKKPILNVEVFDSYDNKWEDVKVVNQKVLDAYETVKTIRLSGSANVYLLAGKTKRWITSSAVFQKLKLNWDHVAPVNQVEFDAYLEGPPVE